jgi:hypothetical protein
MKRATAFGWALHLREMCETCETREKSGTGETGEEVASSRF